MQQYSKLALSRARNHYYLLMLLNLLEKQDWCCLINHVQPFLNYNNYYIQYLILGFWGFGAHQACRGPPGRQARWSRGFRAHREFSLLACGRLHHGCRDSGGRRLEPRPPIGGAKKSRPLAELNLVPVGNKFMRQMLSHWANQPRVTAFLSFFVHLLPGGESLSAKSKLKQLNQLGLGFLKI